MKGWRHLDEANIPSQHDDSKVVLVNHEDDNIVGVSFYLLQFVLVTRSDMERLVTEVMQMKEFLPKV